MSLDTSPEEVAIMVTDVFTDIAECLHHLAARTHWSPGEARSDFEERVGRIAALGSLIADVHAEEESDDETSEVAGTAEVAPSTIPED